MTDPSSVAARNAALLGWYAGNRRTLPWRDTGDPYVTLVSEAMLQQTQVTRVIPRFEAFMDRFPDVGTLAAAGTVELLEAWSGLGYNARALRLRDAAAAITEHGWPTTVDGLRELPGVGPYTAAAIASMAFGVPVAAVDTNLRRVMSRWFGEPLDGRRLRDTAADVVGSPAGDWNQAMMDLGAMVCRPRTPECASCPVAEWCLDPSVYEPPPRQSTFDGSRRQLRGALVRAHVAGSDLLEAGRTLDRTDDEIAETIDTLKREGLIT